MGTERGRCVAGVPLTAVAAGLMGFEGSQPEQAPTLQHGQTDPDLPFDMSFGPAEPDAAALWQLLEAAPQEAAAAVPLDPSHALAPELVHTRQDDLAAGDWFEQPPGRRSNAVPIFPRGTAPTWDDNRCAAVVRRNQAVSDLESDVPFVWLTHAFRTIAHLISWCILHTYGCALCALGLYSEPKQKRRAD